VHLEAASLIAPHGLFELLADLGEGENGFNGTAVARGEMSIPEYLQYCVDMTDPSSLKPGYVLQTVFWALDESGEAIGLVRVRHYLNDRLRDRGGHIGYYIRRARRGRGYGREALRLGLMELKKIGEQKAMLTVDMENLPSRRVIEANGGRLESTGLDDEGRPFGRYWIEMESASSTCG
jgi:predicted acetyltransferase